MVFKGIIDSVTRARAYYLCRVKGLSVRTVASMCKISAASVYRIAHEKTYKRHTSEETCKRGRKNRLGDRDKRQLIRCITVLRKREGNFTCKALMEEAGIQQRDVSVRTVSRFLNSQQYYYLQTRRKGPMAAEDHSKVHESQLRPGDLDRRNFLLSGWNRSYVQKKSTRSGSCTKSSCLEKKIRGFSSGMHSKVPQRGNWGQSTKTDGGNFLQ